MIPGRLGMAVLHRQAIAAGDLTRRVPGSDPRTEVGRLARTLNTMLGQIESAFRARSTSGAAAWAAEDRMRRFVADASHALRTYSNPRQEVLAYRHRFPR